MLLAINNYHNQILDPHRNDMVHPSESPATDNRDLVLSATCMSNFKDGYLFSVLAVMSTIWASSAVLVYGVFKSSAKFIYFSLCGLTLQLLALITWVTHEYLSSSPINNVKLNLMLHLSIQVVPWAFFFIYARGLGTAFKIGGNDLQVRSLNSDRILGNPKIDCITIHITKI